MRQFAARADTKDIDGWFARIVKDLVALLAAAWRTIRELTGIYIEDHAAAEGRSVVPTLAQWNTEQVVTSLRVTGPVAFKTAIADGQDEQEALRSMTSQLSGASERLVLGADRDTVKATVEDSDEIVGWRRVGDGDPCAFCAMLISRGAVYKSGRTAGDIRFGGTEYHDHDHCTAEPIYEHEDEPPEVDDLYQQWLEVTAGKSGNDALRAWREYWDNRKRASKAEVTQVEARQEVRAPAPTRPEPKLERLPEPEPEPENLNPKVLTGSRPSGWQNILLSDTGADAPIPVRDFEIVDGYTIRSGKAFRIDGVTYIIEDGNASVSTERVLREFREIHSELPGASDVQQGYAWLVGPNPADAYWKRQYQMPDFRSFATGGDGAVRIWGAADLPFGPSSYRGSLRHEFGHNVSSSARVRGLHDQGEVWADAVQQDTKTKRPAEFKETVFGHPIRLMPDHGRPYPHGVTSYGTSSPAEDYAEAVRLYLAGEVGQGRFTPGGPLVRIYLRDLFPARARVLDQIFPSIARAQLAQIARERA